MFLRCVRAVAESASCGTSDRPIHREEGPEEHKKKSRDPTMAACCIAFPRPCRFYSGPISKHPFVLLALFALLAFAAIGL